MAKKGKRGRRIVRKFVRHPGTKAQPFLVPALEVGKALIRTGLSRVIARSIEKRGATVNNLRTVINTFLKKVAFAVQRRAIQLAPVDTGLLKRSINVRARGNLTFTVGTNIQYAEAVEFGTRPHIIRPRRKKALAFVVKRKAKG